MRRCELAGLAVVLISSVAWLTVGCSRDSTPRIRSGIDACHECSMVIEKTNEACGFWLGEEFVPFDSPACLLRSYESLGSEERPSSDRILVADYEDGILYPADSTSFMLTNRIPTVMDGRVVCFRERESALDRQTDTEELITDWIGYRTTRGSVDETVHVSVEAGSMDPNVVSVRKNDLVLWRMSGKGLESERVISIRGYPEVGSIAIPSGGEEVEFRMVANRPGAGFPVVDVGSGRPLGMLKVSGAHTADEEAM